MDLSVTADGESRYIVSCPEKMEWDARLDLAAIVDEAITESAPRVILDLNNVSYINSAGLGAIFALRKRLVASDGRLVLARPAPAIQRLLRTVNVDKLIPVADDLDHARQLLTTGH
ncbi:MAG: STAS domain-containing protein [Phycisphaerae bacterium]|nr:STAS domain-containing protein [Phycisphaerae bacterium]